MAADTAALERLTAHLTGERRSDPVNRSIIRVSSSGECSRKIGYRLLGFPPAEPTFNEMVTFEVGHSYHHMLQRWLCEIGWATPELLEVKLGDPERNLLGSCDNITERLNAKGEPDRQATRRAIEIKSITNVAQERYGKESAGAFTRLDKPRDYHLDQANVYAYLWNRMVAAGSITLESGTEMLLDPVLDRVEHITMIYVGKDTSDLPIKIYTQPISSRRIDRLLDKFLRIWTHVRGEELPPRDYDPFGGFPPCKFCPYLGMCMAEGRG